MKTEIEAAIKILITRISKETDAGYAMKLTQAALNLSHTLQVLNQVDKT